MSTKQCWICYETEEASAVAEDVGGGSSSSAVSLKSNRSSNSGGGGDNPWINPCACTGSGKWVHENCLLAWVDVRTQQRENLEVRCPQCQRAYVFYRGSPNVVISLGDAIWGALDAVILPQFAFLCNKTAELGFYWLYGAVLDHVAIGYEAAAPLLDAVGDDDIVAHSTRRLMYTVVLFSLQEPNQHIFCSMVMTPAAFLYRDHPSTFLMMCVPIVSLTYKMYMGLMYGNLLVETSRPSKSSTMGVVLRMGNVMQHILNNNAQERRVTMMEAINKWYAPNRALALLTPLLSATVGYVLFGRAINNTFYRTCAGGLVFNVCVDLFRMVYAYHQQRRLRDRRILPYWAQNNFH